MFHLMREVGTVDRRNPKQPPGISRLPGGRDHWARTTRAKRLELCGRLSSRFLGSGVGRYRGDLAPYKWCYGPPINDLKNGFSWGFPGVILVYLGVLVNPPLGGIVPGLVVNLPMGG